MGHKRATIHLLNDRRQAATVPRHNHTAQIKQALPINPIRAVRVIHLLHKHQTTWHNAVYKTINHPAETKEVKVVDQEAYSYDEPIYGWRTFCNVCGADITENCQSHMKEHALAGEGGRYHDEYVQVDSKTISVPEKSHTETVVVKEAWTEKILVKEAGWY